MKPHPKAKTTPTLPPHKGAEDLDFVQFMRLFRIE